MERLSRRCGGTPAVLAVAAMLICLLLAGCAGHRGSAGNPFLAAEQGPEYAPTHYYPPPGPAADPWGPYIMEAAARFQVPQQWIRAVMQQESGGEEQAVSPVGAMGLMQIMPATYQDLQASYGLGNDPFNPENNILAGAAYIHEMYARYGSPGFLAAYNAGPDDVDSYLAGASPLPDETVNYLAMVTPNLGTDIPASGPFASYAVAGAAQPPPSLADFASGCDVNAAYDPDHPCQAPQTGAIAGQPVILASAAAGTCDADKAYDPDDPCAATQNGTGSCDADSAYDPDNPCTAVQPAAAVQAPPQPPPAETAQNPQPPPAPDCGGGFNPACPASVLAAVNTAPAPAPTAPAAASPANWGIQVGAFSNPDLARNVARSAAGQLADEVAGAAISLPATTPFGGHILYEARLIHLTPQAAATACATLNARQLPCVVVQPGNARVANR